MDSNARFTVSHLVKPTPPWTLGFASDALSPVQAELALAEYGVTARVLNGAQMRNASALFDEFALRFYFPEYFGHNWSALKDCLVDLAWLPGIAYAVVIQQARYVLEDEQESKTALFLSLIDDVALEWAAPISRGEDWDRPAIPFHLVLHETSAHLPALMARLQRIDMDIPALACDLGYLYLDSERS
jgi:RNAse (barnase) inhibitor barstar